MLHKFYQKFLRSQIIVLKLFKLPAYFWWPLRRACGLLKRTIVSDYTKIICNNNFISMEEEENALGIKPADVRI